MRKKSLQLAKNIKAAYRQGQIVRFTTLRDEYEKVKKEQLKHENKVQTEPGETEKHPKIDKERWEERKEIILEINKQQDQR